MKAKNIFSGLLIGFIVISIGYLISNETKEKPVSVKQNTGEQTKPASNAKDCAGCEDPSKCGDTKPASVPVKSSSDIEPSSGKAAIATAEQTQDVPGKPAGKQNIKVVAYYFHGEVRCTTCNTIEKYAKAILAGSFPDAMDKGALEFREVNIDEETNQHFIDDFELSSSSLVIVKYENGKQKKWKNLVKVWQLVHDKPEFDKYTRTETGKLLGV